MTDNFSLNPEADNYCLAGNPVEHSISPQIHHAFASQAAQNIHYQKILVDIGGFAPFLELFRKKGGKGLNVTLPFKGDACRLMDETTARAGKCESVNTIWFSDEGTSHGDTTDGRGLVRDLLNNRIDIRDREILVLGAGGAVRGILMDLFEAGPACITIVNRTYSRAEALVGQFQGFGNLSLLPVEHLAAHQFDIIINGTSASLKGELPPLPQGLLKHGASCYDMAYTDRETVFVQWARQQGAVKALDGMGMLVEQAAESFFIWRGVRPDTGPVIDMLRRGRSEV